MKLLTALAFFGCLVAAPAAAQQAVPPAVRADLADMKANCPNEQIKVVTKKVDLAPGADAYVVDFLSSGACFGQPGQNSYLIVNGRKALTAEPGFILVGKPDATGHAPIKSAGIGLCVVNYVWRGGRYVVRMTKECRGMMKPSLTGLAAAIREAGHN